MSDTCPKCGAERKHKLSWYFRCGTYNIPGDKVFSHSWFCEQIAQLRDQLAKAEAEAKRYREAWIALRSYVNSELTNWDIRNGDRWLQTQLVAMTMDDLIPPAKGEGE